MMLGPSRLVGGGGWKTARASYAADWLGGFMGSAFPPLPCLPRRRILNFPSANYNAALSALFKPDEPSTGCPAAYSNKKEIDKKKEKKKKRIKQTKQKKKKTRGWVGGRGGGGRHIRWNQPKRNWHFGPRSHRTLIDKGNPKDDCPQMEQALVDNNAMLETPPRRRSRFRRNPGDSLRFTSKYRLGLETTPGLSLTTS